MAWKEQFARGVSRFQASQLEGSLRSFNKAIELDGDQYVVYDSRAAVYEKLGSLKDALQDAKKVIDLAPNRWQGYARSARLFLASHKHGIALTMIRLALERIKSDDTKRRVELVNLTEQVHEAMRQIDERRRRTTYHFGKLPVEIAGEIFREVVSTNTAQVIVISHVCKHWRAIVLNSPALWTTLVLTGKDPVGKARLWTKRSKGKIRELWTQAPILDDPDWSFRELQHLHWDALRICTVESWDISGFLQQISKNHILSNLEELNVVDSRACPARDSLLSSLDDPKLHTLKIEGSTFSWDALSSRVTGLTSLVVRHAVIVSGTSVLSAIEANPMLETLVLDFTYGSTPRLPSLEHPLSLLHLRHLEIGGLWSSNFFDAVAMPSLRALRLFRANSRVNGVLARLADRGSTLLTELRIQSCSFESSALITFLQLTNFLETLELSSFSGVIDPVVEALANPTVLSPLQDALTTSGNDVNSETSLLMCPSLARVDFSHCPNVKTGPLVRLVKSRLGCRMEAMPIKDNAEAAPSRVAQITTLKVDGCPQVEVNVLPWLRSKVATVSCVYMTKKAARWKR